MLLRFHFTHSFRDHQRDISSSFYRLLFTRTHIHKNLDLHLSLSTVLVFVFACFVVWHVICLPVWSADCLPSLSLLVNVYFCISLGMLEVLRVSLCGFRMKRRQVISTTVTPVEFNSVFIESRLKSTGKSHIYLDRCAVCISSVRFLRKNAIFFNFFRSVFNLLFKKCCKWEICVMFCSGKQMLVAGEIRKLNKCQNKKYANIVVLVYAPYPKVNKTLLILRFCT